MTTYAVLPNRGERPPRVPPLGETEKSWVAGLLDCDGSVSLVRHRMQRKLRGGSVVYDGLEPCVSFHNTNRAIIDKFAIVTGLASLQVRADRRNPNQKTIYEVGTNRMGDISELLSQVEHYLVVKAEQACLLLEWIVIQRTNARVKSKDGHPYEYTPRQREIYGRIRELNARGRR